jgi:hypothetical protein
VVVSKRVTAQRAFFIATVCISAVMSGSAQTPSPAPAPPTAAPRAMVRQADQRIRELQAQADRLADQSKTLLTELRALEL